MISMSTPIVPELYTVRIITLLPIMTFYVTFAGKAWRKLLRLASTFHC